MHGRPTGEAWEGSSTPTPSGSAAPTGYVNQLILRKLQQHVRSVYGCSPRKKYFQRDCCVRSLPQASPVPLVANPTFSHETRNPYASQRLRWSCFETSRQSSDVALSVEGERWHVCLSVLLCFVLFGLARWSAGGSERRGASRAAMLLAHADSSSAGGSERRGTGSSARCVDVGSL